MADCPVCTDPMTQKDRDGITIDVCDNHGVWLDKSELLSITETERHRDGTFLFADLFRSEAVTQVDHNRTLNCPHCQKQMAIEKYQGVHMDWCMEHGIFLDSGELNALLNNLRLDPLFVGGVALRLFENKY